MAKKSGKGLGRGLDAIFATENVELVTDNDKVLRKIHINQELFLMKRNLMN